MLDEAEKQHAFLTPKETVKFLLAFQYTPSFRMAYFGLETGLRPKELTYLEWHDIDLEMKTAKIKSKPPLFVIKDNQERTVQLNKIAVKILTESLATGLTRNMYSSIKKVSTKKSRSKASGALLIPLPKKPG